jgi:hypothetical protein
MLKFAVAALVGMVGFSAMVTTRTAHAAPSFCQLQDRACVGAAESAFANQPDLLASALAGCDAQLNECVNQRPSCSPDHITCMGQD